MSSENEPLRRVPAPAPELEAEGEVDFSRYAGSILGKWWLLLLGVLIGGALGFVYGQGGGSTYQAQATLYLGQPLSPNGSAVATLASDPTGVATIARSQSVVNAVSEQVGIPPGKLRRNTSAAALGERNRQATNVALIGITVRGSDPEKIENAANLLAEQVVTATSGYASSKAETLQHRLDGLQSQLESVSGRLDEALATIESGSGADSTDRLLQANLATVLEQQRADLTDRVFATEQLLQAAEEVEQAQIVSPAAAGKIDARNARTSALVGAFLGLVAAALIALLWGSISRRRAA